MDKKKKKTNNRKNTREEKGKFNDCKDIKKIAYYLLIHFLLQSVLWFGRHCLVDFSFGAII